MYQLLYKVCYTMSVIQCLLYNVCYTPMVILLVSNLTKPLFISVQRKYMMLYYV